jgi:hypothetical protein
VLIAGAFVRACFPTSEQPRRPGLLHIVYCVAVARPLAVVAYTSSQPWPPDVRLPPGVRIFPAAEAAELNQRPFVLYLNRLARLPLSPAWFPELEKSDQGVIAHAPARLRQDLMRELTTLLEKRRSLVEMLGPDPSRRK